MLPDSAAPPQPPSLHGAACRVSRGQLVCGFAIIVAILVVALCGGANGRMVLGAGFAGLLLIIVLAKISALTVGLIGGAPHDQQTRLPEDALPRYSVLVPLYREAAVLEHLIAAMTALDYPREKLEVILLVEEIDRETRAALANYQLPAWIRIEVVPAGRPQTKPRACNLGLQLATGELLVVFDAEDRPDPDQLRQAAGFFSTATPRIACLQARLNIDNAPVSCWSRWFATEYTLWFDAYLPGLHALGAPLPLGGTSNHFRAEVIQRLAWDAWNVAEDCDLGMRLSRAGYQTAMLASTTWEEAPTSAGIWLRQRSRWSKGWLQTLLVQAREPITALRDMGWWRWTWMWLIIGGQILGLLSAPVGVVLAGCWWWQRWDLWDPAQPWTVSLLVISIGLVLAMPLLVVAHQLALIPRRAWRLLPWTLLLPAYWLCMGIATWRGCLQLITAPFLWEKTPHGAGVQRKTVSALVQPAVQPAVSTTAVPEPLVPAPLVQRPATARHAGSNGRLTRPWRLALAGLLCLTSIATAGLAWQSLRWLGAWEKIKLAQLPADGSSARSSEVSVEANWIGTERINFTLDHALTNDPDGSAVRATVWIKVVDGEWFQCTRSWIANAGDTTISFPVDSVWMPVADTDSEWSAQLLMRVRATGVRVQVANQPEAQWPSITGVTATGSAPSEPQIVSHVRQVAPARCQDPVEFRCVLAKPVREPFSQTGSIITGIITGPLGSTPAAVGAAETPLRVPGFLTRDFTRKVISGSETLSPAGPPAWAVRWTPQLPGDYSLVITCTEADGTTVSAPPIAVQVAASTMPGSVTVDGKWFRRAGAWFYPQGINLRSPHDDLVTKMGIPQPHPAGGSTAMETAIIAFSKTGWNLVRVWLSPSFGGLEWDRTWAGQQGLGAYSLQAAWQMDRVMQTAREHGMVVDLALWQHGPFSAEVDAQWENNPYRQAAGGPLSDPANVLTDATARQHMQQLARYGAARWGGDPALFAWTLWIEVDGVTQNGLVDWHRDLARDLAAHDPGHHPISTEFRSATGDPAVWALPEISYTQVAAYNTGELATVCEQRAASLNSFDKPALIEEIGGQSYGGSPEWLAHEIHDGPWLAWVLPLAGSPWPWWWNVALHHDLGQRQRLFAEHIVNDDLSGRTWRYQRGPLASDGNLEVLFRLDDNGGDAWIHRPLRLFSGRGMSDQYRRLTPGFSPLAHDPGQLFPSRRGRVLRLDRCGLDPQKLWDVEVVDTWTYAEHQVFHLGQERGMSVPLDYLVRDAAVRIRPTPAEDLPKPTYRITALATPPAAGTTYDQSPWKEIQALAVNDFNQKSSAHHPQTEVKIAVSPASLHLRWRIHDRFVASRKTAMNSDICADSCVEAFFAPAGSNGYINLEINAGGVPHASFVDQRGIKFRQLLSEDDLRTITIHSSMPSVIEPEIATPVTWEVGADIPLELMRKYAGPAVDFTGQWRGNFYKCADETSAPHWASWSPLGGYLNFHRPDRFGYLEFPTAALGP